MGFVGDIIGGLIGADATEDAAEHQADASQYATDAQIEFAEKALEAEIYYGAIAAGMTEEYAQKAVQAIVLGNEEAIKQLEKGYGLTRADITRAGTLQREAIKNQAKTLWQMYGEGKKAVEPYKQTGDWALKQLKAIMNDPGKVKNVPGYQFRLEQGNKNILSNASATGGLASGRTLKALQEYGQDYATNEYQTFLKNYFDLAGMGERVSGGLANMAMRHGENVGNAQSAWGQSAWNEFAGKAELQNSLGVNLANIYQGGGKDIANIMGQTGTNLANIYGGIGKAASSSSYNIGNAIAGNAINQGNIWGQNAINQGNIWGDVINSGFEGLGSWAQGGFQNPFASWF